VQPCWVAVGCGELVGDPLQVAAESAIASPPCRLVCPAVTGVVAMGLIAGALGDWWGGVAIVVAVVVAIRPSGVAAGRSRPVLEWCWWPERWGGHRYHAVPGQGVRQRRRHGLR
jgi:hypothetical protein